MIADPKTIAGGVATTLAAASLSTDAEAQGFEGFYAGISVSTFGGHVPTYSDSGSSYDDYIFLGNPIAGGFFGYNHGLNNGMLVGFEMNVTAPQQIQDDTSDEDQYTMRAMLEARARVGYQVNESILAYGFLGATSTVRTNCCYGREYALYGLNAGIGGEYMLSDSFGIGAEYTFRQLNAYDDFDIPQAESHSLSLRAAFHF